MRGYGGPGGPGGLRGIIDWKLPPVLASTRLLDIDVSDPTHPKIARDLVYDGDLVSARQTGDVVRLVLSSGYPGLDFVHPSRKRTSGEARRHNRRVVRDSVIDDWLPQRRDRSSGDRSAVVACTAVTHPRHPAGFGTISVLGFRPGAEDASGPGAATAITASGSTVYSSVDHLYVATTRSSPQRRPRTAIHAFTLDGTDASYAASGMVMGSVEDRWRMDEQDGRLRVATALGHSSWRPRENAVVVLEEQGAHLVKVGKVAGMGDHEQIRSVRWLAGLAVLVTFRQVDPVYTVDLSQSRPRVAGELKIPGFSGYLHPIGGGLVLGLGQDANRAGLSRGAQLTVFDISDPTRPVRVETHGFGPRTEVAAEYEPRAFTWVEATRTGYLPVASYGRGRSHSWLSAVHVGADGALRASRVAPRTGGNSYETRALPLPDGRIALTSLRRPVRLVAG